MSLELFSVMDSQSLCFGGYDSQSLWFRERLGVQAFKNYRGCILWAD